MSNIARENYLMTQQSTQNRKLRTRTLIQAGGLLSLSGLFESCDISESEDLQNDLDGRNKAATLLGILIETNEKFFENGKAQDLQKYKTLGEYRMRQAASKYM